MDPEKKEGREGWSGLSKERLERDDERNGRKDKERNRKSDMLSEQKTLEKDQECLKIF